MFGYIDAFRYFGILAFFVMPLVAAIKQKTPKINSIKTIRRGWDSNPR